MGALWTTERTTPVYQVRDFSNLFGPNEVRTNERALRARRSERPKPSKVRRAARRVMPGADLSGDWVRSKRRGSTSARETTL